MRIPLIHVKDKQAFGKAGGITTLAGKPTDVAKGLKEKGAKLLHIVDADALAGSSTNLDTYNNLTYFINVEVECAPEDALVKKLLSFKCRVVLPPGRLDVSKYREKKLLVAKLPRDYAGGAAELAGYHDVVLDGADDAAVARFAAMGKRVIIYDKDEENVKSEKKSVWGVIVSTF